MRENLGWNCLPVEVWHRTYSFWTVSEVVVLSCCSQTMLAIRIAADPVVAVFLGSGDEPGQTSQSTSAAVMSVHEFMEQPFSTHLRAEILVPLDEFSQALKLSTLEHLIPLRGFGDWQLEGMLVPPGRLEAVEPHRKRLKALTVQAASNSDVIELLDFCTRLCDEGLGGPSGLAIMFLPDYVSPDSARPAAVLHTLARTLPTAVASVYMNDLCPDSSTAWRTLQLPHHVEKLGCLTIEPDRWEAFESSFRPQPHVCEVAVLLVNPLLCAWRPHARAGKLAKVLLEKFPRMVAVDFCLAYAVEDVLADGARLAQPPALEFLRKLNKALGNSGCKAFLYSLKVNQDRMEYGAPLVRAIASTGYAVGSEGEWDFAPPVSFRRHC